MATSFKEIEQQAQALAAEDRAKLAETLLESLQAPLSEIEMAWAQKKTYSQLTAGNKGDATLYFTSYPVVDSPHAPLGPNRLCPRAPSHHPAGNRREKVFFTDDDRHAYLGWLKEYAEKHEVDILAYCLMPNHIHLVAVPATEDNLQQALKPLHMRYAQRINRARGWKGHVWQGRFFLLPAR